jgi:hypothetical protein
VAQGRAGVSIFLKNGEASTESSVQRYHPNCGVCECGFRFKERQHHTKSKHAVFETRMASIERCDEEETEGALQENDCHCSPLSATAAVS